MSIPTQGKTIHELESKTTLGNQDKLLIGDNADLLKSKKVSLSTLRAAVGSFVMGDEVENPGIAVPAWTVEGIPGGWRISIQTAVENAVAYLVYFYNEEAEMWLPLVGISETRGTLGSAAGPLVRDVMLAVASEEDVAPITWRKFYVVTVTVDERSSPSAEKGAWSMVKLPPDFEPSAPVLVDDDDYPYTAVRPVYNGFAHIIVVRLNAADGEAEYIERYEFQRKRIAIGGGNDGPWTDLPKHTLVRTSNKPATRALVYMDEASGAVPGSDMLYRARAVDWNGTISEWSNELFYTVEDDKIAPDVPVITVTPAHLSLKLVFDEPKQATLPCPDWRYWQVEVKKGSGGTWGYIDGKAGIVEKHDYTFPVLAADLASAFYFRAKAVDWSGNASAVSTQTAGHQALQITEATFDTPLVNKMQQIATIASTVVTHTTEISQNATAITLRATKEEVGLLDESVSTLSGEVSVLAGQVSIAVIADGRTISSFVAGVSGLQLQGKSIKLTGETEFSSDDLNPTKKVDEVGGRYDSASSGARVRIFPSGTDYGLQVIDNSGNDVLRVYVSGDNVGDVIIGGSSQYVKWDKSAGQLIINGSLGPNGITGYLADVLSFSVDAYGLVVLNNEVCRTSVTNSGINTYAWGGGGYAGSGSASIGILGDNNGHIALGDSSGNLLFAVNNDYGIKIKSTLGYYVGDNKVLGPRGAAVADATGAGDVVAQLNALLARCRAHGLIAT